MPWPISERAMRITQRSSGMTTTQALTSGVAGLPVAAAALLELPSNPNGRPSASPPPAVAEPTMNSAPRQAGRCCGPGLHERPPRESAFGAVRRARCRGDAHACRHAHGGADALIGAAAADVGHRLVDVVVGRVRFFPQQRGGGHDLPRLAIAALRDVEREPGFLHGMRAVRRKPFDRDDPVGGLHGADRNRAGTHDLAVEVHRARAALRDAAAVFGAGEADLLADDPQERSVGLHLHVTDPAVDVELGHRVSSKGCPSGRL